MIAFNEMTGLTDNGRAVDVVYLDFSKTLDAAYRNILIGKTGWTARQKDQLVVSQW